MAFFESSLWILLENLSIPTYSHDWTMGFAFGGSVIGSIWGFFYHRESRTVQELRQRLGESEPCSVYRNLSAKQLQKKTLNHIRAIHKFVREKDFDQLYLDVMIMTREVDEEARPISLFQKDFRDQGLHIESLKLRDELWARLPINCQSGRFCNMERSCTLIYSQPLTLNYMVIIANDLERLAYNLKT